MFSKIRMRELWAASVHPHNKNNSKKQFVFELSGSTHEGSTSDAGAALALARPSPLAHARHGNGTRQDAREPLG